MVINKKECGAEEAAPVSARQMLEAFPSSDFSA
jgi:hypothetical protein